MNDDTLEKLIAEIDAAPVVDAPRSHTTTGKPDGFIFITANRSGLIHLARCFLQAALSPINPVSGARPVTIDEPHSQVFSSPGDLQIGFIEHSATVPISETVVADRRKQAWKNDGWIVIGCWVLGIAALTLMVSGIVFWIVILSGFWK